MLFGYTLMRFLFLFFSLFSLLLRSEGYGSAEYPSTAAAEDILCAEENSFLSAYHRNEYNKMDFHKDLPALSGEREARFQRCFRRFPGEWRAPLSSTFAFWIFPPHTASEKVEFPVNWNSLFLSGGASAGRKRNFFLFPVSVSLQVRAGPRKEVPDLLLPQDESVC